MQSTKRHDKNRFTVTGNLALRRLLDAMCDHRADYREFQKRRQTSEHRLRRNKCKNLWIISGLVMLLHPVPGFVLPLALFTTFVSFAILDH